MSVAEASLTRLADVAEATIGTIPTSPVFQVRRFISSSVRLTKQVEISNEIRADRNVPSIIDVGRTVQGTIETEFHYGSYDDWLERLFASTWNANVLKNGITHAAATLESTYEQGATDSYVRLTGCRWNTMTMTFTARAAVRCSWELLGITSPSPTNAILSGATYTAATTTPAFNGALNVASLTMISSSLVGDSPLVTAHVQSLTLNINNNISPVDILGQYYPYAHIFGRFDVSGTATILFESVAAYSAVINHEDVAISITLTDSLGNDYIISIPKAKLNDGGPSIAGNGTAVVMEVPFQGYLSSADSATIIVTRQPA